MERILNLQELEAHPDWYGDEYNGWVNDRVSNCIAPKMIGKSVEWCKDYGYKVNPEMIANTATVTHSDKIETWTKTMNLRLQQQEINQLGETRWVDVETFKI